MKGKTVLHLLLIGAFWCLAFSNCEFHVKKPLSGTLKLKKSRLPSFRFKRHESSTIHSYYNTSSITKEITSLEEELSPPSAYLKDWKLGNKHQMAKLISISSMLLWIVYVYSLTRDIKDALIISNCGAESIAFLKVYGVIPTSILFTILYNFLASRFSTENLFYVLLIPFITFYVSFGLFFYPYRDFLHPLWPTVAKNGMNYALSLVNYWSFSIYYLISELWGSAAIPLLFWSCVNDIISREESLRVYPVVSLLGNLGPIIAGTVMSLLGSYAKSLYPHNGEKSFELLMKYFSVSIGAAGLFIAGFHSLVYSIHRSEATKLAQYEKAVEIENRVSQWENNTTITRQPTWKDIVSLEVRYQAQKLRDHILPSSLSSSLSSVLLPCSNDTSSFLPSLVGNITKQWDENISFDRNNSWNNNNNINNINNKNNHHHRTEVDKSKSATDLSNAPSSSSKHGLFSSLSIIQKDPILFRLAMVVLAYGISMEFTELLWKAAVQNVFPLKTDYVNFLGRCSTLSGVLSLLLTFVGANLMEKWGWKAGALTTPWMAGFLAFPFFLSLLIGPSMLGSRRSLLVAMYLGLLQTSLAKSAKFTLFDPTKEIVFAHLPKDRQKVGKAAVEMILSRFGKSLGAFGLQVIVLFGGNIISSVSPVAILYYVVLYYWMGRSSLFDICLEI